MKRLAVAVVFAGCAYSTTHVGGGDAGVPDAAPDAAVRPDAGGAVVPIRDCTAHFAVHPDSTVTSVALAGQWDWNARTPMLDPDGDGIYTVDQDLAAGLYAYKFVLTHADGTVEWIEDPSNPYRAYDGGVENSGARVPDCTKPLVAIDGHQVGATDASFTVHVARATGGASIASFTATLRHDGATTPAAFTASATGTATVALTGLAPGKYTLALDAADSAGAAAETVLAPFWVEATPFDWHGALIYMVMTDRFRDGDPSNDPAPSPGADPAADFHGGDLKGVKDAIDDGTFDALGVRALWLSPFIQNATVVEDDGGHGVTAYHGYWPVKARAVDPRLGSEADLDALVAAAHHHGMRVLMDFVINHVHQDHEYVSAHPDWFRQGCICGDPNCDWTTHRLDCMFHPYLPDVNWTNREAGEQIISDALWWLERFDLDGLRIDAVKHVEDAAIFDLSTRVRERFEQGGDHYFLLGETAMGWEGDDVNASLPDYDMISHYIAPFGLDGQFDFVLYHASAYRVFADDAKGMLHLDYWTRMSAEHYPADAIMSPFVGSHDSERILSLAQYTSASPIVHHKWASDGLPVAPTTDDPYDRASVALTWLLTAPGAPLLYYGDEYGEYGGADPDNRHMWKPPAARDARQNAMYAKIARVGTLRAQLPALQRGSYQPLTVTEDVLSFARATSDQLVLVAINKSTTAQSVDVAPPVGTPDGTWVDRNDPGGRTLTSSGGHLSVPLAPRSAAILVEP